MIKMVEGEIQQSIIDAQRNPSLSASTIASRPRRLRHPRRPKRLRHQLRQAAAVIMNQGTFEKLRQSARNYVKITQLQDMEEEDVLVIHRMGRVTTQETLATFAQSMPGTKKSLVPWQGVVE